MINSDYYSAEEIAVHLSKMFGVDITPMTVAAAAGYLGLEYKKHTLPFTNCKLKIIQKLYFKSDLERITNEVKPIAMSMLAKKSPKIAL